MAIETKAALIFGGALGVMLVGLVVWAIVGLVGPMRECGEQGYSAGPAPGASTIGGPIMPCVSK